MAWILDSLVRPEVPGEKYVREYQAVPGRNFALDFAWPNLKVGIEVQGGVWSQGPSGHKRAGHVRDMEKLNLCQLEGWIVLQFSTDMIRHNPAGVADLVVEALRRRRAARGIV